VWRIPLAAAAFPVPVSRFMGGLDPSGAGETPPPPPPPLGGPGIWKSEEIRKLSAVRKPGKYQANACPFPGMSQNAGQKPVVCLVSELRASRESLYIAIESGAFRAARQGKPGKRLANAWGLPGIMLTEKLTEPIRNQANPRQKPGVCLGFAWYLCENNTFHEKQEPEQTGGTVGKITFKSIQ